MNSPSTFRLIYVNNLLSGPLIFTEISICLPLLSEFTTYFFNYI